MQVVDADIFRIQADALVNPVNCVGVMGKGLALQFKRAFPPNFQAYVRACRTGALRPGKIFIFETGAMAPKFIVNFPTKRHWRDRSRLEDIEAGLRSLEAEVAKRGIGSIAIPPLGCGLGGLSRSEVFPLIRDFAERIAPARVILVDRKG